MDLDSDGDLDLITGSFGQRMGGGDTPHKFLLYHENIGTRSQPRFTARPVEYEGQEPTDILGQPRPLDFNNDGLIDLVVSTGGNVYLAQNVGTKQSPKWKLEKLTAPWGLAPLSATQLIDWNGDGYLDLVRSPLDGYGSEVPKVFTNKGLGTHGVFDAG